MSTPNKLYRIITNKCPRCRRGNLYNQSSVFPFKTMMDMPKACAHCKQPFELETGFYFGTGYVSYGMSVGFLVAWFIAYAVLIGFSWQDNSVFYALFSGVVAIVLIQPWLMRLSRSIYIGLFVKFEKQYE
jgi:hypothetical protein